MFLFSMMNLNLNEFNDKHKSLIIWSKEKDMEFWRIFNPLITFLAAISDLSGNIFIIKKLMKIEISNHWFTF